jgi:lysine 6-dehydrogenase
MGFRYLVLGAGRQGTAAAYDLVRFGEPERAWGSVTLADADGDRARAMAERVNRLTGSTTVDGIALDVSDQEAVRGVLPGYTVALSAVPYYFNLPLTRAAIDCRVSFCDLGGHTGIVRQQHALHEQALQAGVRIVPDCGMGPGMGNTLGVYAMELLDRAQDVYLYDAGLPHDPQPAWNYLSSFSLQGLTNEYYGGMTVLRDGELVHLPCFTEMERIDFPPVGELEAFIVAGGVSTAPWTFFGKLRTYQLKIMRYPGTFCQLKAYHDLGLFDPNPVEVDGTPVNPRRLFETLYGPHVYAPVVHDISLIRARAVGEKDGRPAEAVVDLVDRYDEATGFTSMERTTGWHAAIVAHLMARQETPLGAVPLETAVPGGVFVDQARQRGFSITERVTVL